jgi:hypothetical protein
MTYVKHQKTVYWQIRTGFDLSNSALLPAAEKTTPGLPEKCKAPFENTGHKYT